MTALIINVVLLGLFGDSTQCDGTTVVQKEMASGQSARHRAQHLCLVRQSLADPAVLAVATDDRCRLES